MISTRSQNDLLDPRISTRSQNDLLDPRTFSIDNGVDRPTLRTCRTERRPL